MSQPNFPNERLLDVYKALELAQNFDVNDLDQEVQNEGVNGTFRDYDLYHSAPGTNEEYIVARPRTGKGVQFACDLSGGPWVPNGHWDPANQDIIDPSAPVPGVNAPIQGGPQLTGPNGQPLPPGVYGVGPGGQVTPMPGGFVPSGNSFVRMDKPKQLHVDPELAKGVGVGTANIFGDALDALLDAPDDSTPTP